jgi:hypothetical protein
VISDGGGGDGGSSGVGNSGDGDNSCDDVVAVEVGCWW